MTHTAKQKNDTILAIFLIIINFAAIIGGFIGLSILYQNNKTDGFGSGQITVQHCAVKDSAWLIYSCEGGYSSSKGMIQRANASVTVFGKNYKQGEKIADVYPALFTDITTTEHFVTGRERASVTYNTPWLIIIYFGVSIPLATALFLFLRKPKRA